MCWGGEDQGGDTGAGYDQPQYIYIPQPQPQPPYQPYVQQYQEPIPQVPPPPQYMPYSNLGALGGAEMMLGNNQPGLTQKSNAGEGFSSSQESTTGMIPGATNLLKNQRNPIYTWG